MKHGKNNFDSIRIMAAVAVIFDHSHAICVYIYAFPVQQSVAHLADNRLSAIQIALVTLPIVLVLAWLSWHLVEKPMLSLKTVARSTKISGRIDGVPSIEGCG